MTDNHHTRQSERETKREAEMPIALMLADKLEKQFPIGEAKYYLDGDSAAELRRLHALTTEQALRIGELVEALRDATRLRIALYRAGDLDGIYDGVSDEQIAARDKDYADKWLALTSKAGEHHE